MLTGRLIAESLRIGIDLTVLAWGRAAGTPEHQFDWGD